MAKRNLSQITDFHLEQYKEIRAKRELKEEKRITKKVTSKKATDTAEKEKAKANKEKANAKAGRKSSGRTRNVKKLTEEQRIKVAAIRKYNAENRVEFLQKKYSRQQETKDLKKFLKQAAQQRQENNPDIFNCTRDAVILFQSENFCNEQLKKFLFKDGQPTCPYCEKETVIYEYKSRNIYKCKECERQFNLKTGTPFHKCKIPTSDFLYILLEETAAERGLTCQDVKDRINVSLKTGHLLLNKIRATAFNQELFSFTQTGEPVECDTAAYFGSNVNRYDYNKFTATETYKRSMQIHTMKQRMGSFRAELVQNLKEKTMLASIKKHIPTGCTIYTDEHKSYANLAAHGYKHETTNHFLGEHARGTIHTNSAESFNSQLKTGLRTHNNRISKKYLQYFINSIVFNLNVQASQLSLCEKFMFALENLCMQSTPQIQLAKIKRMLKRKSIFAPVAADMYETKFDKEYKIKVA